VLTTKPDVPEQGTHPGKHVNRSKLLKVGILSISNVAEDHDALRKILDESRCRITKARTCKEAVVHLSRKHMPVVICASDLPDGTWRDVLSHISTLAHPPLLVVTSTLADDYLWAEVLNRGGYNVLAKPFCESEVMHVVSGVWMQKREPVCVASAGSA
jgi:DNA-binding NtrC family response regulator